MENCLTTKQMEILILAEAVTNYCEFQDPKIEYSIEDINSIDADIEIRDMIRDYIEDADETDFEILQAFGYVDNDYKTTILGKQYIKLFNEDCKNSDEQQSNFKFVNKVELNFSLMSIEESSILSAISKLIPKFIKIKK